MEENIKKVSRKIIGNKMSDKEEKSDFPRMDYIEKIISDGGNNVTEQTYVLNNGHKYGLGIPKHTLVKKTSFENGVKVEVVTKMYSKTPGIDVDGWENHPMWQMVFHDGELVELKAGSDGGEAFLYHASFKDGAPIGEYEMPLNPLDGPEYSFNVKVGDELLDNLPKLTDLQKLQGTKVFAHSHAIGKYFKSYEYVGYQDWYKKMIVAKGSWKDGKFTGSASLPEELGGVLKAHWENGNMHAEWQFYKYTKPTDEKPMYYEEVWENDKCDVLIRDPYHRKETYTHINGKKEGVEKISRLDYMEGEDGLEYDARWGGNYAKINLLEETEYKNGKKDSVQKNIMKQQVSFKNGVKHGLQFKYSYENLEEGEIVQQRYYENGKDCTKKYNRIKQVAAQRIEAEKKMEEATGKKARLQKMSKFEKTVKILAATVQKKTAER